jgi:hypothetical protein
MSKLNKGTGTSKPDYDLLIIQDTDEGIPMEPAPLRGYIGLPMAFSVKTIAEDGRESYCIAGKTHPSSFLLMDSEDTDFEVSLGKYGIWIVDGDENSIEIIHPAQKASPSHPEIVVRLKFRVVEYFALNLDGIQSSGKAIELSFDDVRSTDRGYAGRVTAIGIGDKNPRPNNGAMSFMKFEDLPGLKVDDGDNK